MVGNSFHIGNLCTCVSHSSFCGHPGSLYGNWPSSCENKHQRPLRIYQSAWVKTYWEIFSFAARSSAWLAQPVCIRIIHVKTQIFINVRVAIIVTSGSQNDRSHDRQRYNGIRVITDYVHLQTFFLQNNSVSIALIYFALVSNFLMFWHTHNIFIQRQFQVDTVCCIPPACLDWAVERGRCERGEYNRLADHPRQHSTQAHRSAAKTKYETFGLYEDTAD